MNNTIYRCEGSCNGVTTLEGKNCGDKECNLYANPLKPFTQCDNCASLSANDHKAHGCAQCVPQKA